MFEEQFTVSQTQVIQTPEMSKPVARVRYGTETNYLTEHKFLGFIKYKKFSHKETVWDNEFIDFDVKTGEAVNITKIRTKRPKLNKQSTVVTGEDK
jgi:hypothetical protein